MAQTIVLRNNPAYKEGSLLGYDLNSQSRFNPVPITLSRDSEAYVEKNGVLTRVNPDVPRIDSDGALLVEPQRTNLFLNSETLSTQSVTVSNTTEYSVSFYGTGSITFLGGHTGTLNGTGASDKVTVTFTTSSTSVTCTVLGSVTNANFEQGAYSTTWIKTEGATATRSADVVSQTGLANLLGDAEGSLYVEAAPLEPSSDLRISLGNGTSDNRVVFRYGSPPDFVPVFSGLVQATIQGSSIVGNAFVKLACRYAVNDFAFYQDGTLQGTDTSGSTYPDGTLTDLKFSDAIGNLPFYGKIKALAVYDTALDNTELANITTNGI